MTSRITREGLLEGKLAQLDGNVSRAVEMVAQLVETGAQQNAPVLTGTMERSVSHTPTSMVNGVYTSYVGPGSEAPYAKYTELDAYMPKTPGVISAAKGAIMPWLRPAAQAVAASGNAKAILVAAIQGALR